MPGTEHDIGIGSRVRAARRRLGWSREALAFHAGISWSAISQLEGGRRRNLRPSTLAALAGALGVTVDYLVFGEAGTRTMLEHRALLYETDAEFLAAAGPFVDEATEGGEPVLVAAGAPRLELLRERLGPSPHTARLTDRAGWGVMPADVVNGVRAFLGEHLQAGAPWVRILVEPAIDGVVAQAPALARYEMLLNLAFAAAPLTVLCAYDAGALDEEIIAQVRRTHPHSLSGANITTNAEFVDPVQFAASHLPAIGERPPG